jgi:hypothetical protein
MPDIPMLIEDDIQFNQQNKQHVYDIFIQDVDLIQISWTKISIFNYLAIPILTPENNFQKNT